jgi:predicted ester cyclase
LSWESKTTRPSCGASTPEVWEKGNVSVAHEVFDGDYVRHDLLPSQALPGPAGQAKIAEDFRRAFPDLRFEVDLVLGEDDLVAARWTATGTHTGPWGSLEPTGKRATFSGVNIFRFADGKSWRSGTTATTSGS